MSMSAMDHVALFNSINFIVKNEDELRTWYTIIHNSQMPVIKWELTKYKRSNRIFCKQLKKYYHSPTCVTVMCDELPKEYYELVERKYNG